MASQTKLLLRCDLNILGTCVGRVGRGGGEKNIWIRIKIGERKQAKQKCCCCVNKKTN